jgi:electron transport complex protein RnfB
MTNADLRALAARILDALPQTQCRRCGYADCADYAQAIAAHGAAINQCPPGGAQGIDRLAAITGQAVLPLNPEYGREGPRHVAWIDEAACIGCTLCIQACPLDCIVGGNKRMHTVIESQCTGCELCIAACPVDCMALDNVSASRTGWNAWTQADADAARQRYALTSARRQRAAAAPDPQAEDKPAPGIHASPPASAPALEHKRATVEAALARARAARQMK